MMPVVDELIPRSAEAFEVTSVVEGEAERMDEVGVEAASDATAERMRVLSSCWAQLEVWRMERGA